MNLDFKKLENITRITEDLELIAHQLSNIDQLFDYLMGVTDGSAQIPILINGDDSFEMPFGMGQFVDVIAGDDIEDGVEASFALDVTTTIKILGSSREHLIYKRNKLLSYLKGMGFNINSIKNYKHETKH